MDGPPEYRKPPSKRFPWMWAADGFAEAGLRDTTAGRRKFLERLEGLVDWSEPEAAGRVRWEGQSLQSTLERGWYSGAQEFRERLLAMIGKGELAKERETRLLHERGDSVFDYDQALAARVLEHGLRVLEHGEDELGSLKKGDWRKALLANVLCENTSVKQAWIAKKLEMGTKPYVSRLAGEMGRLALEDKKLGRLKAEIAKIIG